MISWRWTRFLLLMESAVGALLTLAATALYLMWLTGRGEHGEIAFLYLGAVACGPIGIALFAAAFAARRRWPGWAWFQLAPLFALAGTTMWFRGLFP
jgi:hypothetical protein